MGSEDRNKLLRRLPAVDEVLQWEEVGPLLAGHPRTLIVKAIRQGLQEVRKNLLEVSLEEARRVDLSRRALVAVIQKHLAVALTSSLKPVVNATGVVLHTNLGRAVLAEAAREQLANLTRGYCNLELDLCTGERGSRYSHVEELLTDLTGAEAAVVVNNNAAAVLLALNTLARGRKVVVSRGQLVEIGGSFRVPEVMEWSGCRLVEVGTTNKTHLRDYERAIDEEVALLLKVHTSNYRILGFTAEVKAAELVQLGRRYNLPVMEDLGSGVLVDLSPYGLPYEPTVQESVAAGIDVVTFSGDKLLGGPQAGIIVGKRQYLEAMKKNPLTRALRIDKLTLGALEATLRLYLNPEMVCREIPVLAMLTATPENLRARAEALARQVRERAGMKLEVTVEQDQSQVGGGAMPLAQLPTWVVALKPYTLSARCLAEKLRAGAPPVLGRIAREKVLLDVRTLRDGDEEEICRVLAKILG